MCSAFCWILVLKIKFYEKQIYVTILFQQLAGIPEKQSISFLGPIIIIPVRVSRYKHPKVKLGFVGEEVVEDQSVIKERRFERVRSRVRDLALQTALNPDTQSPQSYFYFWCWGLNLELHKNKSRVLPQS